MMAAATTAAAIDIEGFRCSNIRPPERTAGWVGRGEGGGNSVWGKRAGSTQSVQVHCDSIAKHVQGKCERRHVCGVRA